MSLASQISLLATRVGQEIKAVRATINVMPTFTQSGVLALITDTGAKRWYNDTGRTLTILKVRATVGTAPTGSSVIFDIHKNGTTIFTTQGNRPTVAISGITVLSSAPNVTTIADGEYLTSNIDQIGSTIAGSDATVTVVMV